MTHEPTEAEKEQMRQHIEEFHRVQEYRNRRRRGLREARKEGNAPPPRTPYGFFLPNTSAHVILEHLSKKGPSTRWDIIEGQDRHTAMTINAQILRLLDYGLVDRDHFAVYSITDRGEEALQQLDAGISHTRWLR